MTLPVAMLVMGARPNFVKVAPIITALRTDGRFAIHLVHTGQHYDPALSDVFFRELGLPTPDDNLGVGSGSHASQTGAVMSGLEDLVVRRRPTILVTVGDVNSTLAAALVAAKAGIPQAHVEAGLRSGDPTMPEEVNRVVVDRLADLLFTHSIEAEANLIAEGVPRSRIHPVGNVMIDTLVRLRPVWQGTSAGIAPDGEYGVVTLHRPSNVDDLDRLAAIGRALGDIAASIPIVFPAHPRTRPRLDAFDHPQLSIVDPLGYLAFLDLVEHARFVLTDSGGLQEETTVLQVPCLTLRDNTERPITTRLGTNRLIGTAPTSIAPAVSDVLASSRPHTPPPPQWDGQAASRIAHVLGDWVGSAVPLRLSA